MIVAACVDDGFGLRFAGRRQSRDRVLVQKLLELAQGRLRIAPDAMKLFADQCVYCGPDWLTGAGSGDWCFCEDASYMEQADAIEKIVLFQWNRSYPADTYFTFPGQWACRSREDFAGSSHEKITIEVYEK